MNDKLIKEKGVLVQSSMTKKDYEKNLKELEKHFLQKRKEWKQDTVLIRVEGQDFIVPKKDYINSDDKQSEQIIIS